MPEPRGSNYDYLALRPEAKRLLNCVLGEARETFSRELRQSVLGKERV